MPLQSGLAGVLQDWHNHHTRVFCLLPVDPVVRILLKCSLKESDLYGVTYATLSQELCRYYNIIFFRLFPFYMKELRLAAVELLSHSQGVVGHVSRHLPGPAILFLTLHPMPIQGRVIWVTEIICASLRGALPFGNALNFGGGRDLF